MVCGVLCSLGCSAVRKAEVGGAAITVRGGRRGGARLWQQAPTRRRSLGPASLLLRPSPLGVRMRVCACGRLCMLGCVGTAVGLGLARGG